jgi:hypothetical protein
VEVIVRPWDGSVKRDPLRVDPLRDECIEEDTKKCLKCNELGRYYLYEAKDLGKAYVELRKGVLGTGESDFSLWMTNLFNMVLERFCAEDTIDRDSNDLNFYLYEIRSNAVEPDYRLLRETLANLVSESEKAGRISDAIRFEKELIFFIILEGTPDKDLFCNGHDRQISEGKEKLRSLMAAMPESDRK